MRAAGHFRVFCVFRSQLPLAGPRRSTNYETRERRERNPEESWTRFPRRWRGAAWREGPEQGCSGYVGAGKGPGAFMIGDLGLMILGSKKGREFAAMRPGAVREACLPRRWRAAAWKGGARGGWKDREERACHEGTNSLGWPLAAASSDRADPQCPKGERDSQQSRRP